MLLAQHGMVLLAQHTMGRGEALLGLVSIRVREAVDFCKLIDGVDPTRAFHEIRIHCQSGDAASGEHAEPAPRLGRIAAGSGGAVTAGDAGDLR